jgi:hypothetical protein
VRDLFNLNTYSFSLQTRCFVRPPQPLLVPPHYSACSNSTSDVSLRVRAASVRAAAHMAQVACLSRPLRCAYRVFIVVEQVVPCHVTMFTVFGALLKSR